MRSTIDTTAERSIIIIRRRPDGPHHAPRRTGAQGAISAGRRARSPSTRTRVAHAFRTMAHAVGAATAGERTKAFYRSSGLAWALKLG